MSDTATEPTQDTPAIQQLRDQASKATRLEKENAFLRAGIDLGDKMAMRMFKQYDGDMTIEAIKAEAEDWGLNESDETTTTPDPAASQDEQQEQFAQAQGGAPSPAGAPPPPKESARAKAWKEWNERDRGKPEETHQLALIDKFISGAAEGDKDFLFDEEAWLQERSEAGYDFRPKGSIRS